jgi:hypothetical protein
MIDAQKLPFKEETLMGIPALVPALLIEAIKT